MRISRILHAGYLLEASGTTIVFDPIFENPFSRNCYAYPSVDFNYRSIRELNVSAVFISHYHDDHCSMESLNLINRETPIFLYCTHDELFSMIRDLGFRNVHSLKLDESVRIGAFSVIPRRALNPQVDSLFQIEASGLKVLNVVDAWIDEETLATLKAIGPWDLVLWPFQTLLESDVISPSRASVADRNVPEEWIAQLRALKPRLIVASSCQFIHESWSWYNRALFPISYKTFCQQIESKVSNAAAIRLDPSESIELTVDDFKFVDRLSWILPLESSQVDYGYIGPSARESTADLAKRFAELNPDQTDRIVRFCQIELLERFRLLEESNEEYFRKRRVWRLSLYDHAGLATHFYYRLQGSQIEAIDADDSNLGWTTEIAAFKLFTALNEGESLTSIYLRVNDSTFSPSIEKEIAFANGLEDPLIRCLYAADLFAYQRAQMKCLLPGSRTQMQPTTKVIAATATGKNNPA